MYFLKHWTIIALAIPTYATTRLSPGQIKNLVTFGDSYTDVGAPADGGVAWPVYAAGYSNVDLFPFARSGATCSNNITSRPFPSLFESQLPLYFTEKSNGSLTLESHETLYTLWIGTNDIGGNGLLTGHGAPGASLVKTTSCAVNWVKVMYESGARNFLFQNMIPLQHTPLYSADSYINHYWTLQRNTTEWSVVMAELVLSGNALSKLMLETVAPSFPEAHIGLFDSYGLFTDMINNPADYLNGTAPLNTTVPLKSCVYQLNEPTSDTGICTIAQGTDKDSFLWFDELHPSEQADRMVAREITGILKGKKNRWTTWIS
ncbi:GDSL lipase/acylhydrolase [Mycena floridula]|nr:GDSL lipase/acylhydrolase [Mycena floridula]